MYTLSQQTMIKQLRPFIFRFLAFMLSTCLITSAGAYSSVNAQKKHQCCDKMNINDLHNDMLVVAFAENEIHDSNIKLAEEMARLSDFHVCSCMEDPFFKNHDLFETMMPMFTQEIKEAKEIVSINTMDLKNASQKQKAPQVQIGSSDQKLGKRLTKELSKVGFVTESAPIEMSDKKAIDLKDKTQIRIEVSPAFQKELNMNKELKKKFAKTIVKTIGKDTDELMNAESAKDDSVKSESVKKESVKKESIDQEKPFSKDRFASADFDKFKKDTKDKEINKKDDKKDINKKEAEESSSQKKSFGSKLKSFGKKLWSGTKKIGKEVAHALHNHLKKNDYYVDSIIETGVSVVKGLVSLVTVVPSLIAILPMLL